jgi:alpha,alpha-trehalase
MNNIYIKTPERDLDKTFMHILDYWPSLTQSGDSLAFSLPGSFVRPGGFFKMFFYWDSYFTLLGLVVQGKWQLAREIVENLIAEIEEFGFVPNYNNPKTVCRSRSQPPFLTAAIAEVYPFVNEHSWLERAVHAAIVEYEGYWLVEPHLTETGLSRYSDTGHNGCVTIPDTPHYRAIAESGWDNTPRFGNDITHVLPVDLNCQLYRYEKDFSLFSEMLGRPKEANAWRTKAEARRTLINQYFWDEESGFYWDYDLQALDRLRSTPRSLASFVPLWAEVANQTQASRMLQHLPVFEYEYGLVACEKGWNDDSEHNYPTGWAYSHWYVIYGLRCYQYHRDATRIAMKWLRLNARKFVETGVLRERYNVVQPDARLPGRYGPQRGFGWTNGIFAALLIRVIFGIEVEHVGGQLRWEASFPDEWQGQKSHLSLPDYPYPTGITV